MGSRLISTKSFRYNGMTVEQRIYEWEPGVYKVMWAREEFDKVRLRTGELNPIVYRDYLSDDDNCQIGAEAALCGVREEFDKYWAKPQFYIGGEGWQALAGQ